MAYRVGIGPRFWEIDFAELQIAVNGYFARIDDQRRLLAMHGSWVVSSLSGKRVKPAYLLGEEKMATTAELDAEFRRYEG